MAYRTAMHAREIEAKPARMSCSQLGCPPERERRTVLACRSPATCVTEYPVVMTQIEATAQPGIWSRRDLSPEKPKPLMMRPEKFVWSETPLCWNTNKAQALGSGPRFR